MSVVSAIELRVGNVISYKNGRYKVLKREHVKPGKGGAFCQLELKEIQTGQKLNERLRSDETVDKVVLMTKPLQFLYDSGSEIEVMDQDTYEQLSLSYDMLSDEHRPFLKDEMILSGEYADGELLGIVLPQKVEAEIKETESYVRGQTATGSFKPAILTNGVKVQVPQYMEAGQKIIVDTGTMEFSEKA